MSIPEPWPATGPKLGADSASAPEQDPDQHSEPTEPADRNLGAVPTTRLNQPWRAAVAAIEALAAVLLVLAAWQAWQHGFDRFDFPVPGGPITGVKRMVGSWVTASFTAATLAGLLALDALRQLRLAVRTGRGFRGLLRAAQGDR